MTLVAQIFGGILVALVLARAGLSLAAAVRRFAFDQDRRRLSIELLRQRVDIAMAQKAAAHKMADLSWSGYRKFEVARKETEADDVASFYLLPHNRMPLPPYRPGQYLTFRFHIPGRAKPLIRCYSLSDAPDGDQYRITVKRLSAPPDRSDLPAGMSSSFLHEAVSEGSLLDVMAPTGHFHLDETTERPVVLIGGGIGLTPVISMLNAIARAGRTRETWFFYAVNNARQEVMGEHLREVARGNPNIHVRIAHSRPGEGEQQGLDYDYDGHVTAELLKRELPSSNYDFYICGPPPMMSAMIAGLREWEVPEERIHFEAFGAATIQRVGAGKDGAQSIKVTFERSGKTLTWHPEAGTLLDLAEKNGVAIDYGCRAGNCGTCVTAVRSGEITYLGEPGASAESGTCLTCISIPKSPLVLDA